MALTKSENEREKLEPSYPWMVSFGFYLEDDPLEGYPVYTNGRLRITDRQTQFFFDIFQQLIDQAVREATLTWRIKYLTAEIRRRKVYLGGNEDAKPLIRLRAKLKTKLAQLHEQEKSA